MRLEFRHLRLALALSALPMLAGCGGFAASPSVSPASFFLPGLLKADPQAPSGPEGTPSNPQPVKELAEAR